MDSNTNHSVHLSYPLNVTGTGKNLNSVYTKKPLFAMIYSQ